MRIDLNFTVIRCINARVHIEFRELFCVIYHEFHDIKHNHSIKHEVYAWLSDKIYVFYHKFHYNNPIKHEVEACHFHRIYVFYREFHCYKCNNSINTRYGHGIPIGFMCFIVNFTAINAIIQ